MSLKQNDHFNETVKEVEEGMSTTANCKKSILKADEIVFDLKKMTRVIDKYSMTDNTDFLGCGSLYCIEKICLLEISLKYLKKSIRILDK